MKNTIIQLKQELRQIAEKLKQQKKAYNEEAVQ